MRSLLSILLLLFAIVAPAYALDQGEAYQACQAAKARTIAHFGPVNAQNWPRVNPNHDCAHNVAGKQYTLSVYVSNTSNPRCVASDGATPSTSCSFTYVAKCEARSDQYGWLATIETAVCHEGCSYIYTIGIGMPSGFSPTGSVCSTDTEAPPRPDTDGDGVPDDEDAFPNDPNESKDTDGDGIGDNADFAPDDPTDGEDTGDGDEKDNKATGGGDCRAPPGCVGDSIQCNQLFQQWSTRCSTGSTVSGDPTKCAASYTCNGDSIQCSQVALMRASLCKAGQGGNGDGDDGQPGWTKGNPPPVPGAGEGPPEGLLKLPVSLSLLDRDNFLGAPTCPQFPSFTIMGFSVDLSDQSFWCQLVTVLRICVIFFCGYTALMILLGRV